MSACAFLLLNHRLESYSCKMVSEEKRQYKDLVSRLEAEGEQESCLRLGPSRTIRGLRELTGHAITRSSYQMSTSQAEVFLRFGDYRTGGILTCIPYPLLTARGRCNRP